MTNQAQEKEQTKNPLRKIDVFGLLESLPYRYQVLEACLIVEECIDAVIGLYLPGLNLSKKPKLELDQKIDIFEYFLTEDEKVFTSFPRMIQNMRNKVAHNRGYKVDDTSLAEFFDKLPQQYKNAVEEASTNAQRKTGEPHLPFKKLEPKIQFALLVLWFTIGMSVELDRGPFVFIRQKEWGASA